MALQAQAIWQSNLIKIRGYFMRKAFVSAMHKYFFASPATKKNDICSIFLLQSSSQSDTILYQTKKEFLYCIEKDRFLLVQVDHGEL